MTFQDEWTRMIVAEPAARVRQLRIAAAVETASGLAFAVCAIVAVWREPTRVG